MKVVTLHESNFREAAASLRAIADEIDAGEHGEVAVVGIAMRSSTEPDGVHLFSCGPESEPPITAMLFYKAFHKMSEMF